ncbi:MAG: pyridoxamine 5'-phosphate oxidase family protein, partial [Candidatus Bathyarchaeia archaeon]
VVASSESKKMKNIHINPKVSLTIDIRDASNPFNNRGVMVQGKAIVEKTINSLSIVKDKKLVKAYENFRKKYPVLKKAQSPVVAEYKKFSDTLIRITPSKMVYWRGPNFITVNFSRLNGH